MNQTISKSMNIFVVSLLSSTLWVSASHAALILKVEDLTNNITTTVTDNGTGDLDTDFGSLISKVSMPNSSFAISTGTSKPLGGNSGTVALMDLLNIDVTADEAIDLVISLTDTDFNLSDVDGLGLGLLSASIGGTLGSSISNSIQVDYFFSTSNEAFDTTGLDVTSISSTTWNGTGAFAENVLGVSVDPVNSPFSLTQVATIHLEAGQMISYDSELSVVGDGITITELPEPSILLLISLGFAGLIATSRRKS